MIKQFGGLRFIRLISFFIKAERFECSGDVQYELPKVPNCQFKHMGLLQLPRLKRARLCSPLGFVLGLSSTK